MITESPDPVCECGSKEYRTWCQKYYVRDDGQPAWTTKAEREANPQWTEYQTCPCVWVSDDTWIECEKCKKPLTKEHVDRVFAEWRRYTNWKPQPFRIVEEVGEAIWNDYIRKEDDVHS